MKKLLRIFSSRYFLAVFAFLMEFVQLTAVFVLLRNQFWPVNIAGWALQLAVLLYLVNRDEIPEFKLPWILLLLLIPVTGAFIFLLFATNDASRKQRRRHENALDVLRPYMGTAALPKGLHELSPHAALQAEYLSSEARAACCSGTAASIRCAGMVMRPCASRSILSEFI